MFIRLDDLSFNSDIEKWSSIFAVLEENSISAIVGVIPDNMDPEFSKCCFSDRKDFWHYVRALQGRGHCIFLHGLNHLCNIRGYGQFCKGTLGGETLGSFDYQYNLLNSAVRLFQENDVRIDGFMAPRHNFNNNTLNVLRSLDIFTVSDRYFPEPVIDKCITFIPVHYSKLPSKPLFVNSTVCLHPENMSFVDIELFRVALEKSRLNFYNPTVVVKSLGAPKTSSVVIDYFWRHYVYLKGAIRRIMKSSVMHFRNCCVYFSKI